MKLVAIILLFQTINCDWIQDTKLVRYFVNRADCKPVNTKYVEKVVCFTKVVNRTVRSHTNEILIRPEFNITDVYVEAKTYKKFGTVYRPTLVYGKENFCELVLGRRSGTFGENVMKIWKNRSISNFFDPCPLKGRKYRFWKTEVGNNPAAPPLMPIGEWKLGLKLVTYMNGFREFLIELYELFEVKQVTATQF